MLSKPRKPKARRFDEERWEQEILAAHAALNLTEEHEDEVMPLWKSELYLDAGVVLIASHTESPTSGTHVNHMTHQLSCQLDTRESHTESPIS